MDSTTGQPRVSTHSRKRPTKADPNVIEYLKVSPLYFYLQKLTGTNRVNFNCQPFIHPSDGDHHKMKLAQEIVKVYQGDYGSCFNQVEIATKELFPVCHLRSIAVKMFGGNEDALNKKTWYWMLDPQWKCNYLKTRIFYSKTFDPYRSQNSSVRPNVLRILLKEARRIIDSKELKDPSDHNNFVEWFNKLPKDKVSEILSLPTDGTYF